jgi:hypothetical protein
MLIRSINFTNLRSFKEAKINFNKINHITGRNLDNNDNNGTGKTTIVHAILLLLGGSKLVDINLDKFVNDSAKSASIEGMIECNGDILEITRTLKATGTSTLKVLVNGQDPECKTSSDYQNLLFDYIGSVENFKKFRLLDSSNGINILDFTSGQLRKTLMSLCQDKFDNIRAKLLAKKTEFEKYNKDLVLSKHAPSESRLKILETSIKELDTSKLNAIIKKIQEYQNDKNKLLMEQGKLSQDKNIKVCQLQKMQSLSQCPTCLQKVSQEYKSPIIADLTTKINECNIKIQDITIDSSMYNDVLKEEEQKKTIVYQQKQKLLLLKQKLETRLQQKDYKYSNQDIEIAKKAIEVIDEFANYYVVEWINTIEPIVNSYLSKLNMQLHFNANEEGKLEILIQRGEKTYTYNQLSQGEKIFISTLFKIALLLERQEQGCIFADESFDCLSYENLTRIIDIISNLPIQLIFVTHQQDYQHQYASTIYIEKKNGVSEIK